MQISVSTAYLKNPVDFGGQSVRYLNSADYELSLFPEFDILVARRRRDGKTRLIPASWAAVEPAEAVFDLAATERPAQAKQKKGGAK